MMNNILSWINTQRELYARTQQIPYILAIWFPYHLIALAAVAYGVFVEWSWTNLLLAVSGWILLDGVGNNLTLHRLLSHQSWQPRSWMRSFLYWAATMVGEGSPLWWAALHRGHHHRVSDQPGKDIHTPVINGRWHSYMGWQFGIQQDSVNFRYAADLLRDRKLIFIHNHYNKIIYSTLLVSSFIFGIESTVWFFIVGALMSLHADGLVNTFGHVPSAGYRNFDNKDVSTNVWWIGYFHWGSGWHNNHHRDASSFDFGTTVSGRRFEFDPCLLLVIPFATVKEIKRLWSLRKSAILSRQGV